MSVHGKEHCYITPERVLLKGVNLDSFQAPAPAYGGDFAGRVEKV